jgi:hypothetical protein
MKLVKFNDFVKNKINEDIEPIQNPTHVSPELEEGIEKTEKMDIIDQSNIIDEPEQEEGEEEAGEYKGTIMMKELASRLGVKMINNQIQYGGHKINFYSEDEKFTIDNRKKFDKVDDVIKFLEGNKKPIAHSHESEMKTESRKFIRTKRK